MELLKVALRNVRRNTRRSVITAMTVFIGIVVVCSTRGLLNGLQGEIRSGLTRKIHGDLQIHKTGYREVIDADPYKIMFSYDAGYEERLTSIPEISSATPRLRVMGLLNHQKSQISTPVMITGIDTHRELKVCPRLQEALQEGRLIASEQERFKEQAALDDWMHEAPSLEQKPAVGEGKESPSNADSDHQIMITPSLMKGLNASLGDEIVILVQDRNNMQQAIVTKIVGVIDYALPTAVSRMAWMDFKTLQTLTRTQGQASEWALRTAHEMPLQQAKESLARLSGPDTLVETWLELSGFLADVLQIQDIIFSVIVLVVFAIMISAIINTSLMTVMERTREIGTLAALGYRRRHIIFLFMAESASISSAGGALGALVASLGIAIAGLKGLVIALPGQKVATTLYPYIPLQFLLLALFLAFFAALIASLAPAYRASKMKPVDALGSA